MVCEILSAKTDIIFKKMFTENKDLLSSFVSSALDIPEESIKEISILNSEIPPESISGKFSRLDINMEVDGRLVNVEIQVNKDNDYRERSLFYWALLYTSGINKGDKYEKLKQTITINILDFNMFDGEDYHSEVYPAVGKTGEVFSDKMKMHFFELKKLPKSLSHENLCELWLHFIKAESKEEFEMIKETDIPVMKKAVKVIYDMSEDTKIREAARMREKALHDEASALGVARREGRAETEAEMVAEMREKGLSEELIAAILQGVRSRRG